MVSVKVRLITDDDLDFRGFFFSLDTLCKPLVNHCSDGLKVKKFMEEITFSSLNKPTCSNSMGCFSVTQHENE